MSLCLISTFLRVFIEFVVAMFAVLNVFSIYYLVKGLCGCSCTVVFTETILNKNNRCVIILLYSVKFALCFVLQAYKYIVNDTSIFKLELPAKNKG